MSQQGFQRFICVHLTIRYTPENGAAYCKFTLASSCALSLLATTLLFWRTSVSHSQLLSPIHGGRIKDTPIAGDDGAGGRPCESAVSYRIMSGLCEQVKLPYKSE